MHSAHAEVLLAQRKWSFHSSAHACDQPVVTFIEYGQFRMVLVWRVHQAVLDAALGDTGLACMRVPNNLVAIAVRRQLADKPVAGK